MKSLFKKEKINTLFISYFLFILCTLFIIKIIYTGKFVTLLFFSITKAILKAILQDRKKWLEKKSFISKKVVKVLIVFG